VQDIQDFESEELLTKNNWKPQGTRGFSRRKGEVGEMRKT
jgi:hypothetical protein